MYRQRASGDTCASRARLGERPNSSSWMKAPRRTPDRPPEYTGNPRYAYDNNYEYRVYGKYTGKYGYEPNSNLKLPIFKPTRFEVPTPTPAGSSNPRKNMIPEPLLCALLSCPRQPPSRSGKKNLSAKTGPER